MTRWLAATVLGCTLAPTALAVEGLEWNWEGQERRYLLRTDVQLPEVMWVNSEVGRESRVVGFALDVVTTCVGTEPAGRKGYNVTCTLEDLTIIFDESPSAPGVLAPFAQELDGLYTGKPVELVVKNDGRITSFEVQGLDETNRRINQVHQPFREMLRRAFATLEVRLPRRGSDGGAGTWREVGTMAMQLPSTTGTMGRANVVWTVDSAEDGMVSMSSAAEGIIGTGEMINDRPKNQYNMQMTGLGVFDVGQHALVRQAYVVTGLNTASSQLGEQGSNVGYRQRSEAKLIPAAARVELPESGERLHSLD